MFPSQRWAARTLAAAVVTLVGAGVAPAQVGGFNPVGQPLSPRATNPAAPRTTPATPRGVAALPQLNAGPGVAIWPAVNRPVLPLVPNIVNPVVSPVIVNPVIAPTLPVNPTPAVQVRQPGWFVYKGPDLMVNQWTGTVYKPNTGVVVMKDGSEFYYVPGTGTPNGAGKYASGTGLYYNPTAGTYFNPKTGVITKPGTPGVLPPWAW
jgi:hypothetical protein